MRVDRVGLPMATEFVAEGTQNMIACGTSEIDWKDASHTRTSGRSRGYLIRTVLGAAHHAAPAGAGGGRAI